MSGTDIYRVTAGKTHALIVVHIPRRGRASYWMVAEDRHGVIACGKPTAAILAALKRQQEATRVAA